MVLLLQSMDLPGVPMKQCFPMRGIFRQIGIEALAVDSHLLQRFRELCIVRERRQDTLHGLRVERGAAGDIDPAEGAAERCPQAAGVAERRIDGFNAGHASFEQMEGLAVHRVAEAIHDESWNIALN